MSQATAPQSVGLPDKNVLSLNYAYYLQGPKFYPDPNEEAAIDRMMIDEMIVTSCLPQPHEIRYELIWYWTKVEVHDPN
jgi:hypothetical protein